MVNRSVWYDGKSFTLLDREFNTYIQVPAPDSIDAVLDEIEERLGIVVPLSEMLSENVYRVLTQQIRRASYLGLHQVRAAVRRLAAVAAASFRRRCARQRAHLALGPRGLSLEPCH